jgi:hypothetical protein
MEFKEWISLTENFPLGLRNDKQGYYNSFTQEYPDFNKKLNRRTFNLWVQKYASFLNEPFTTGSTNGGRWFQIGTDNNEVTDNDDLPF